MPRRIIILLAMLLLTPTAAAAAPASGQGGKEVVDLSDRGDIDCDGDASSDLTFEAEGWMQVHSVGHGAAGPVGVANFNVTTTFANAAGEQLVFKDRGPDVVYADGDVVVIAVTGRSGVNHIGRLVIDIVNFVIVQDAGTLPFGGEPFAPDLFGYACDVLT